METDLDSYYNSFVKLKDFVDQNDVYSTDMVNSINGILSKLDEIIVGQEEDFNEFINKVKLIDDTQIIDMHVRVLRMEDEYTEVLNSNEAIISIQSVMIAELRYLLRKDETFDSEVYAQLDTLKSQCDWLYDNFDSKTDKDAIDEVRNHIDDFVIEYEAYKGLLDSQAAEKVILRDLAFSITDDAEALADTQEVKMERDMSSAIIIAVIIGAISIIIGLLLAIFITRSLVKQLTTNMNKLSNSSRLVASASTQLASAGQQLSEGSTEQAASIEETSATMDETSSMVKQNAENTRQANNLSKEASQAAADGSSKMQGMKKSMDELKKSSGEIAKIIKVIDEIAFQTNMLALNAAVEAARAGDAGQGFAVVAEEVRNLAQKSAQAAKDTAEIIDRNIELSEQGVVISDNVNISLEEIRTKTNNVNQLMSEIAAASEEQEKGTAQVTEAIGEMEKVVQINAATAEESAASAEELQTQAQALEGVVYEISKLVKGANAKAENENAYDQHKNAFNNSNQVRKLTANNLPTSKKHIVSPDDVIPLDNNDGF